MGSAVDDGRWVADFEEAYDVRLDPRTHDDVLAMAWARKARHLVDEGYAGLSDADLATSPALSFHWHLLHRGFDRTDGAVLSMVSGSDCSAESLARTALELAISVRYMLAEHRESRLLAFLEDFLASERKRLEQWSREANDLDIKAEKTYEKAIAYRKTGIEELAGVVEGLRRELEERGSSLVSQSWPNVRDRFVAVGESTTYRTAYARMSSQIHADAEDSLRYFIAKVAPDDDLRQSMEAETRNFSRFMVGIAVQHQARATAAFLHHYGMDPQAAALDSELGEVERWVAELSTKTG